MELSNVEKAFTSYKFTDKEIIDTVDQELPEWKKACDSSEADTVMFHPDAFGYTAQEMLLMATAIKYAISKGKAITIVPKK